MGEEAQVIKYQKLRKIRFIRTITPGDFFSRFYSSRVQTTAKETTTPGWILGDCTTATRGRGGPGRGFGYGGGRRGIPPGWQGTGGSRWSPYKQVK